MPSGIGKKGAPFLGWLTSKGHPSPQKKRKEKKEEAPHWATGDSSLRQALQHVVLGSQRQDHKDLLRRQGFEGHAEDSLDELLARQLRGAVGQALTAISRFRRLKVWGLAEPVLEAFVEARRRERGPFCGRWKKGKKRFSPGGLPFWGTKQTLGFESDLGSKNEPWTLLQSWGGISKLSQSPPPPTPFKQDLGVLTWETAGVRMTGVPDSTTR